MLTNPKTLMFLTTLVTGSLISVSSASWYGAWMGLEINLLSFIPLTSKTNNQRMTESALKYFLVQALASMILLTAIVMLSFHDQIMMDLSAPTMITSLALKLGASPLHFWMPEVMEGMTWMNCLLLMSWQKLAPLTLMSYTTSLPNLIILLTISSVVVGAVGGLNQTSIRKIMAFSSIAHTGWFLGAMLCDDTTWFLYFIIYSLLISAATLLFITNKVYYLSQTFNNKMNPMTKLTTFTSMLSLAGMPPFLGFLPKWIVILKMTEAMYILPILIMIIMTLITLYYYMRIAYSAFMLNHTMQSWSKTTPTHQQETLSLLAISISLLGLVLAPMLINLNI
uniref:NADH dehydrogenase subunit 2 n=1 Tax=Ctenolepisma longicaudatum TaxID=27554 RepID=UPI0024355C67|nr:NADH dehydrogenase subunit 2 [Ctenolepisma longicaudatum]WEX31820.1 NADH dehydrogenase subunit 2 [Ctenolepisma longicaudatum]